MIHSSDNTSTCGQATNHPSLPSPALPVLPGHASFFTWEGWRLVFFTVGLVSITTGALNWLYAQDPNYTPDGKAKLSGQGVAGSKEIWRDMKLVMCVPTFLLIVMQVSLASAVHFVSTVQHSSQARHESTLLSIASNSSTARRGTAQRGMTLYSTAQHCTALQSRRIHSTAQRSTAQHSTARHGIGH